MLHCNSCTPPGPTNTTDFSQSHMGPPPRTTHHHSLRRKQRVLHIPSLSQYNPIPICRHNGLHLPPPLQTSLLPHPGHLPLYPHPYPPLPRLPNLLPRLPLRLRLPCPHRLHNLHPRQILQAPPCHVLTYHFIPALLPHLQIPRRPLRNPRRRNLHPARLFL